MGPFTLLALLTGAVLIGATGSTGTAAQDDAAEDPVDVEDIEVEGEAEPIPSEDTGAPTQPADPTDPEVVVDTDVPADTDTPVAPDIGAAFTFDEEANAITIDVGDDETGTVQALLVEGSFLTAIGGSGAGGGTNFDVRFYLVPDGTAFPPDLQSFADAPLQEGDDPFSVTQRADGSVAAVDIFFYLDSLEDLEIGRVDLGSIRSVDLAAVGSDSDSADFQVSDFVRRDVAINSNAEISAFELSVEDDFVRDSRQPAPTEFGDTLFPDTAVPRPEATWVVRSFTSPGEVRFIYSESGGAFEGSERDDILTTEHGAESDFVVNIDGDDGDDSITLGAGYLGTVEGGAGNDTISGGGDATLSGGAGDDQILLGPDFDGTAQGGDGDDVILAADGLFTTGATFDGGAGNDQIIIANAAGFDITTGEGADLVALGPELRDSLLPVTLTDFNPDEDTLVLALGVESPDEVALTIFQNIAENRTEVRATVPAVEAETVTEFGVLLYVEGAPEISVQDIMIVNSLPAPVAA